MKNLIVSLVLTSILSLTGCASTTSGPADYANADRGPAETTTTEEKTETVVTPEPAPIPTKNSPDSSVLDHNSPDQQIVHP